MSEWDKEGPRTKSEICGSWRWHCQNGLGIKHSINPVTFSYRDAASWTRKTAINVDSWSNKRVDREDKLAIWTHRSIGCFLVMLTIYYRKVQKTLWFPNPKAIWDGLNMEENRMPLWRILNHYCNTHSNPCCLQRSIGLHNKTETYWRVHDKISLHTRYY